MNSDCEIKIKDLQKYVPILGDLIETLKEDSTEGAKLSQMQVLHKLLTKPDAGVTLDMVLKCEKVLYNVFRNTQREETNSPGCESSVKEEITETLNEVFNKMDKDDANVAASDKCSKEHPEEMSEQSCDSKTEKETNSNNSELEISEKSEDQNKNENLQEENQKEDEHMQEDDQNKDESLQKEDHSNDENPHEKDQNKDQNLKEDQNLQEENEDEELPNEDISVNQDDPPNKSHESQDLLKDDQPEIEVSEKVNSEMIPADEIIQEGQNHEHDLIENKKEENEICETVERLEEGGKKKEENPQKVENEVTFISENIQEGQKDEQDMVKEMKEEDEKSAPDDVLEGNKNKKEGTSATVVKADQILEEKENKKERTPPSVETIDEVLEEKENKKERTSSRIETIDEVLEEKKNKKEKTPPRVETIDEVLEVKENKKGKTPPKVETIEEVLEEKENKKERTPSRIETIAEVLEEKKNKKEKTPPRVETIDEVLEVKENKKGKTSSRVEIIDEVLEEKENKKERTPPKVETIDEVFEEKENKKERTPSRIETIDEVLEQKENKKEKTPPRVETIDEVLEVKENKKGKTSSRVETIGEVLEEKENKKEKTPPRVETIDEVLEVKENKKERTPPRAETMDEILKEKENIKEMTPLRVEATLFVEQMTGEVEEKKENETEESNDEIQIVQTSPIDFEKPKNCDENKVNTEREENTKTQSKEKQDKNVDVPEKSIETDNIKKEDKNDLELDSVGEVKVVESVKTKKQTSLNEQNNKSKKAVSPSESTSKRVLPKRPKPIESNSTVKAIELKPKDPSEKSAVVYLVKKGAPKPMETIDLLDSDSEDDDVILVSEVGLKKRTPGSKTAAKRMMPANKTPQIPAKVPSVIRQSTQGNKLMFAITSVQSIGQQEQQKRQQQQQTQLAQIQRNKNLIISPAKVRTQGIYTPGTITFHKVKQSQPAGVAPRTYIGVKQNSPLTANKFVNRLNSQIVISNVGSTAGTSNSKPTVGIVNRSSTQNNQIVKVEGPAINLASRSTKEEESPWNPDKDCQRSKDWLENFLSNVLSPTQNVTPFGVDLLQRCLDIPVFARIRTIIEENKKVFVSTLDKDAKVMHENSDEIMALFFKDGSLTDAGVKLSGFAKQAMNRVFTTDRRFGNITSKSRKRPKELDDDEYSPSVIVEFAQETVANRRRSLRRESKANRKQYFAYEDDDDTEFLEMVEEQARIEANNRANKINKIHRKPVPRRSNGSSSSSEPPSVKKMRLEEGTSVETPFETDLLKPTWVEDAVGEAYQDQFNEEADEPEEQDGGAEYSYQEEEEEDKQKQTEPAPEGKMNTWKMSRLGRYHSKWKNFKNINRAHHCRSTFIDSCILCNVKHNFVVAHYVNHHRETEVLIARLTQRDVDQLVRSVNYGYLTASKSTAHQYSATCVFCKREMTFALRYWWEHYSMHTGEYGYECTKCFLRRPRRQHAQKHANNECHLGLAKVRIIYDFDKTMNQIDAYICKLCNYIQIHKENVVNHLTKQHEMQNDLQTNIIRVVLLQIARPYNEDIPGQDSQNNSNSFDYYENFNGGMSIGADNSYPDYDPNDESDVTYMQYSGGMMGHDDLSFMICDMLATDDPTQQLPPSTSFSFDTSSTLKKDGGGTQ